MDQALLFDLDDTLVVDDAAALVVAVRMHARELWRAAPAHPCCSRIGMSSSEGMWCRFENEKGLREWAPAYRREAWRLARATRSSTTSKQR